MEYLKECIFLKGANISKSYFLWFIRNSTSTYGYFINLPLPFSKHSTYTESLQYIDFKCKVGRQRKMCSNSHSMTLGCVFIVEHVCELFNYLNLNLPVKKKGHYVSLLTWALKEVCIWKTTSEAARSQYSSTLKDLCTTTCPEWGSEYSWDLTKKIYACYFSQEMYSLTRELKLAWHRNMTQSLTIKHIAWLRLWYYRSSEKGEKIWITEILLAMEGSAKKL